MFQAVTAEQMAEIDHRAQQEYKIPGLLLMEQAGSRGFRKAVSVLGIELSDQPTLVFAAGGGNNGGDALVMARTAVLDGFEQVRVILAKKQGNEAVELHKSICEQLGIPMALLGSQEAGSWVKQADILFDGLIGSGLTGQLRPGQIRDFIDLVNQEQSLVRVAVDLPSGLSDRAGKDAHFLHAKLTVTFGLRKQLCYMPHTRVNCGDIVLINPGFPPALLTEYQQTMEILPIEGARFPAYTAQAYKNTKGHTAVFAGSTGYLGAALLTAEAALRSRSGLVTLYVDSELYPAAASSARSVIVKPLPSEGVLTGEYLRTHFTACAVGPGWGTQGREDQLEAIIASSLPSVIDADGIAVLTGLLDQGRVHSADLGQVVITPHPGEFQRLTGYSLTEQPEMLFERLRESTKQLDCTIAVKSFLTWISRASAPISVVEGMNPALGTAGSGDVLTGIISALLAQGLPPLRAAIEGSRIHQLVGRKTAELYPGFISEDLLEVLSTFP
ncbi:MAG: NAD(P)H-hydrate dehydratase [Spirochaetota bacterium]